MVIFLMKVALNPARLARWAEEIDGLDEIPDNLKLYRSSMVGELRSELFRLLIEEKPSRGAGLGGPDRAEISATCSRVRQCRETGSNSIYALVVFERQSHVINA